MTMMGNDDDNDEEDEVEARAEEDELCIKMNDVDSRESADSLENAENSGSNGMTMLVRERSRDEKCPNERLNIMLRRISFPLFG